MAKKKKLRVTMSRRETGLGWVWLVFQFLALPALLGLVNSLFPMPLSAGVLNFIYYCINCAFVLFACHGFLGRSLASAGRNFWEFLQAVVLGFVAYWVSTSALSMLLGWIMPGFVNINDQSIASLAGSHYVLMVIGTVILVPTAEEVLFRGLIFGSIQRSSRVWAYVLCVTIFALVHVAGYISSFGWIHLLLCFIQYIPAGLCLAWSYVKADSILAPILIHTAINAIGIYAMR